MGLDIIAYTDGPNSQEFKQKYGFSLEEATEIDIPNEQEYFYKLHPELFKQDYLNYRHMVNDTTAYRILEDLIHIRYLEWSQLSLDLIKMFGIQTADIMTLFNNDGQIAESLCFDTTDIAIDFEENNAITTFFIKRPRMISIDEINALNRLFSRYTKNIERIDIDSTRKSRLKDFLAFVEKSSENSWYWVFYRT